MNETTGHRLLAGLFLWGAALAMVGNALHPFFPLRTAPEEYLAGVEAASSVWAAVHLCLVASAVLLTAGVVMLAQRLNGTAGASLGLFAAVLALLGGALFVVWQGVVDGTVLPALAGELGAAEGDAAILATAAGMLAFEFGLAGLSVMVFLGAMQLVLGLGLQRSGAFASWIRWTLIVAGAAGMVVGTMMFLGIGDAATFYLFRVVGLADTIAAFGLGFQLLRGAAPAVATASGAASA